MAAKPTKGKPLGKGPGEVDGVLPLHSTPERLFPDILQDAVARIQREPA